MSSFTGGHRSTKRLLILSAIALGAAVGLLISADTARLVLGIGLGMIALILVVLWGRQIRLSNDPGHSAAGVWSALFIVALAAVRVVLSAVATSVLSCSAPSVDVTSAIDSTTGGVVIPRSAARAVHDDEVRELVYVAVTIAPGTPPAVWTVDTGMANQVHPLNAAASAVSRDTPPAPRQEQESPRVSRVVECATKARR